MKQTVIARWVLNLVAIFPLLLFAACGEQASRIVSPDMSAGTDGTITDPCPGCEGIFLTGAGADWSICTGGGGDADYDLVNDLCEHKLAIEFAPLMYTSPTDGDLSRETYWAAQISNDPLDVQTIMIVYLLGYHRDAGLGGHNGDSEWIQLRVKYDDSDGRWKLVEGYYSAHFLSETDKTQRYHYSELQYDEDAVYGPRYRDYPIVWVAKDKHANYATRCRVLFSGDDCRDNTEGPRVEAYWDRNIGSDVRRTIDCVSSVGGAQYPGYECFWTYAPGHEGKFAGWLAEGGVTPYREILNALGWINPT